MWSGMLFLRKTSKTQKCILLVLQQRESIESCIIFLSDMIATEEWKREVIKHENIIKELEKKYEKKCKTLKVHTGLCFDYCNANTDVIAVQLTRDIKICSKNIYISLAYYLNIISNISYLELDNVIFFSF